MKQLIILAALSLVLSCVSASYVKTITFNSIVGRNPEKNTILQTGVKVKARCGNSGPWQINQIFRDLTTQQQNFTESTKEQTNQITCLFENQLQVIISDLNSVFDNPIAFHLERCIDNAHMAFWVKGTDQFSGSGFCMEYEKNPHTILNLENDPSPCCYSDEAAYAILSVTITDPDVSRWAKALKIRVTDITDLYVKPQTDVRVSLYGSQDSSAFVALENKNSIAAENCTFNKKDIATSIGCSHAMKVYLAEGDTLTYWIKQGGNSTNYGFIGKKIHYNQLVNHKTYKDDYISFTIKPFTFYQAIDRDFFFCSTSLPPYYSRPLCSLQNEQDTGIQTVPTSDILIADLPSVYSSILKISAIVTLLLAILFA